MELKQRVFIFGHSFVHRFQSFLQSDVKYINLGLCQSRFSVKCYGLGELKLNQSRRLHSADNIIAGADLVILDIGSNDVCEQDYSPDRFVLNLISYANYLLHGLDVKKVVIVQLLYRDKVPFVSYNDVVINTNIILERTINANNSPILFWKHRGMWKPPVPILDKDGVHLSKEIGYPKYLRSMRDCVIRVSRWFA